MKLLVAGSRSIKEYDLEGLVPEGVTLIITGGIYFYKKILKILQIDKKCS